jgi:hypothetical protein
MFRQLKADCESLHAEFDRQFGDPDSPLSPQARDHLAECARCRDLYNYLSAAESLTSVSPELRDKVAGTIKSSLTPVKRIGSVRMIAAPLFLVFALLAVSAASMMTPAGLRTMTTGQLAGISAALLAGAALLSVSLAWQMTPGSLYRIPASVALGIPGAAFLVTIAVLFPWHTPEGFFRLGWHCLKAGTLMAIPAAILFGIVVWRGAPLCPGTLGGTLGAIAGLVSVTILQSNCGVLDAIHLLVWHGGVVVISALTGFLIGRSAEGLHRKGL